MFSFRYWVEQAIGVAWRGYRKLMPIPRGVSVLVYHDVPERDWNCFRDQIAFLHHQYGFINPTEFQTAIANDNVEVLSGVVLTFDDGFTSAYRVAKELLKGYSIKALFFLPTGFLNAEPGWYQKEYIAQRMFRGRIKSEEVPDHMRAMTWNELEWLADEGHIIGAHSVSHVALSQLENDGKLQSEIHGSGDTIEHRLGIPVEWFAFPFGNIESISPAAFRVIKTRYRFCCSSVRGKNGSGTYPYAILRDPIALNSSPQFVRFLVENGLAPYYRKKVRRLLEVARTSD